ncbi:phosphoribosyltransferase family protein [Micrococcaceae bacterium Sec5.7]
MNSSDDDDGRCRARARSDPDLLPRGPSSKHRSEYRQPILRAVELAAGALTELLALALPVDCVCCGTEDLALCAACERQIRLLTRNPFRAEAQAPALMDVDGNVILPVVAAGIYREELAQAVLSFKRHGHGQLETVLGKGLGRAVHAAANVPDVCLVPVPSSNSAFRKRGFSPVSLLLNSLRRRGALSGMTVHNVLRKSGPLAGQDRSSGGQKGLGRGARARRSRGSMRVAGTRSGQEIRGRPCIIVDDVLTTGATLAEAARAVHMAGGVVRGAVVLAATRPPVGAPSGTGPQRAPGNAGDLEKNKPRKDE